MRTLPLFDLPVNYNVKPEWVPRFEPDIMDALASFGAMGWREEIKRRNSKPSRLNFKQGGIMKSYTFTISVDEEGKDILEEQHDLVLVDIIQDKVNEMTTEAKTKRI